MLGDYSHVTLCCVNVVKQGLYCHPFHRYAALENKGKVQSCEFLF